MANDTTINALSPSDSIAAVRKKPHSESINVNKLSFFDELLSIGKFESIVPDAIGASTENRIPTYRSSENSPTSQPDDSIDSSESNSATGSQSAQPQFLVPLTQQLQSPDLENTTEALPSNANPSLEPKKRAKAGEKSVASSHAKKGDGEKNKLQKGTQDSLAPSIEKDLSPVAAVDSTISSLDQKTVEKDDQSQSGVPEKLSNHKPIQKSGDSSQSSDADTDPPKSEKGKSPTDSRPERIAVAIESQNQPHDENSDAKNVETSSTQPRNKRAEHLAQRASGSDPVSNSLDPSTSSSQAIESTTPKAKHESPEVPGLTSSASLSSSSSPIPAISPVITTPIAFTSSVTSTSLPPNAEAISAVGIAATRGGIETSTSNASYSGSVSNPGRPEQARSEVARSNSGTQISAYQEVKLVQRVLRGVEQLANGGGQVRLRLHPPELGSLQMSLRMEAGQVFAKLEVENSTARDALLNNVQTLKDRMTEQGMNVAAFEVEVSTDSSGSGASGSNLQRDSGTGSQSKWENATSRFAQQNNNRLSAEPGQAERMPGAAWTRTTGSLDLTV